MMESLLKRIERNRKEHTRLIALILCLSIIVSLGVFNGFRKNAVAKTYTKTVLDCPYAADGAEPVAHTHSTDCFDENRNLICTLPELEAHEHSDACWSESTTLVCDLEENPGHVHTEECYTAETALVCTLEESEGHQHSEDCYILERGDLICENTDENHQHTDECYTWNEVLSCGMKAGEGAHVHSDDCYQTEQVLTCGMEAGEGAHTHTDDCYLTEKILTCGKEELPVHVHDENCFREEEITMEDEPEAPVVPEMPVGDPNADLETAEDWERDFDDLELSGNWAADLITVAATQEGNGESELNFIATLNDAGDAWVTDGYTRYGAWYGTPYAEWSALFVSFCLRYADIPTENVPNNPTAALMAESFSKGNLFAGADYTPAAGDLIFFDTDEEEGIDHMGIVCSVDTEENTISTIEGDRTDEVAAFDYAMDDEEIVGYGILPQNPDYVPTEENNNNTDETDGLIVEKEDAAEMTELTADGLTVKALDGTALPEDATPSIAVVEDKEEVWNKLQDLLLQQAQRPSLKKAPKMLMNAAPAASNTGSISDYAVFDIGLGTEETLDGMVQVTVDGLNIDTLANVPENANVTGVNYTLYHIHDDAVSTPAVEVEEENGIVTAFTFETDNFSKFVLSYTVDFEYVINDQVYQFSMQGGSSIALSELVEVLHLNEADISTAEFMEQIEDVSSSNPELLEVVKTENDWMLNSLQSFETEESLFITMKDGSRFVIEVTDPATQNISGLLIGADINATKNPDGSYTVYADQPYSIELEFKEQPSGTQFDMTNGFYYPLPAGLFDADSLTGKTMIELSGGDHAGESVELDYHLDGNYLVFTWPDQSSGAYEQLKNAIYTHFKIKISAKIKENTTELDFSDTIKKNVDVKTDGNADVTKTGSYNPATNSIDYTVTVKSTGICKDVVVTDTISGTALTYNNDATASSNLNTSLPTPAASGKGFTFTIPQMGDGEIVTVKYSAAVNLDALTENDDGSLGTVEQTSNKVKVTPSNHTGDEDETSGKDLNNKISYSTISKSSSVGATGEDGHATVTWTIKANQNANVSMAGHTISDLIDANSQSIMKYNGTGITVVRKDADGNTVGNPETIPWSNLSSHSDSAWTWTVPNSSPDTDKLSYEITYTTDVDVNGKVFNTTVNNTATSDNGGSSSGGGSVGPVGGPLVARKVYLGKDMTGDEKTVSWEVNFDVPATGLDSAVIDDTLPAYWNGTSPAIDDYKDGSITITPELAFGESYEVSSYTDGAGQKHMTVTFHKTVDDQKVEGLSGTGAKRKIRVQFQTVLNEDWLEASKTNPNILTHTNNANVILNGQTLGTQASVKIDVSEPEMNKSHGTEVVNVVNNNQLPAWQFFITLSGVSDDTFDENGQIVLYDTYNSRYLDWYPHAYSNWETQNGQVFGGNSDDKFTESSTGKVMTKVSDGQLKIVLNQTDLPMDANGEYYPLYTIPYYLTVKDPIAWKKMIANASYTPGGSIPLYNTVENPVFGEVEDHVDYEVPVVEKKATEPTLTNGVYKLHYTIDINKRALQLGDSDELVMTDEYSNISIDYTTLKIYEVVSDQWGNNTKTEVNDVIWDRSGYISTYYLKNATHYMIEYDAHLSGEGDTINDTQSSLAYTNTAEVFGKKSTWEKTKTIDTSGSGGSRTFRVKVLKHVKGNASQGLPGAVFELWWFPTTADNPASKDNRPDKDDTGWVKTGKTLTTDENGYAQTSNDMEIHSQTWYKLVEVTPPTGYTLKTTHYFFWITEDQTADYAKYVYLNDDVLAINNTPELPEKVNVSVKKVWNDNSDLTLRRDITVHLYADGQPYNEYYSGQYAADARTDADVVLRLNEDGTSETYTWTGLPSGPTYSVVEDPVPGYTTVYSPKNTLTGGELTITNKRNLEKTAISVDKAWGSGTVPSEDVTIQLKRRISPNASIVIQNGADNAGATGAHITDYSVPAGATVKFTWTWKQGWSLDTPALNIYNYGTKELIKHLDEIPGSATEHSVEVTVPADGIIVAFEKPYLNSLSAFQGAFDFKFEVVATGSGSSADDINYNNEHHYLTLSPSNNWHLDIDGLLISDSDGAYTYYIEEVGVNDNTQTPDEAGYVVTYSANNEVGILNGTIVVTNEKEPSAKIQVTKAFSGVDALPAGFRITNDYNDAIFTVNNSTNGDGTTENPYTWVIDDIPAGTEVEFTESGVTVDGYTLTITANGTTQSEGSVTASAIGTAAKVPSGGQIPTASFVNTYEAPTTGSLKIQKTGQVNSADPTDDNKNLIDGTYSFTVAGKADTDTEDNTVTLSITLTKGVATAVEKTGTSVPADVAVSIENGVVTVSNLPIGTYTVTENLTNDQKDAGIRLLSSDNTEIIVTANAETIPTASFVNNIETTDLKVVKVWSDDNPKGITEVSYTVLRIPQVLDNGGNLTSEYDPEDVPNLGSYGYTGRLNTATDPKWTELLRNLPKNGRYTPNGQPEPIDVTYKYYISEGIVDGYSSRTHGETVDGIFTVTITNTPQSPIDKPTEVNVEKKWEDSYGEAAQNKHNDDSVTFQITQNKYLAKYNNRNIHPVTVNLIDGDGKRSELSTVLFVPNGMGLNITPKSNNYNKVRGNGFAYNTEQYSGNTFTITSVFKAREVTLYLQDSSDKWAMSSSSNRWTYSYGNYYNQVYTWDTISESLTTSGSVLETQTYQYSMSLNEAKTGTTIIGAEGAAGQGQGNATEIWKGKVTNLPFVEKTGDNIYIYEYKVTEVKVNSESVDTTNPSSGFDGQTSKFDVKWEQNPQTGTWTITNKEKPLIDITGTKTWNVLEGTDYSNPTLVLKRTVTTKNEQNVDVVSEPETLYTTGTTNPLQPTWTDEGNTRTYTYKDLPKADENGNEYTYTVTEASFTAGGKTYTVTKTENGYDVKLNDTVVKTFVVTQEGNNIVNTEQTRFEFAKVWTTNAGNPENWPTGVASIDVELKRTGGEGAPVDQSVTFTITKDSITVKDENPSFACDAAYDGSGTIHHYHYTITGLDKSWAKDDKTGDWTYSIKETTQLPGYNSPKYFTENEGTWSDSHGADGASGVRIVNDTGVELPQTGGIGTSLFTALGGLMTATAGAILTMKSWRRRKQHA